MNARRTLVCFGSALVLSGFVFGFSDGKGSKPKHKPAKVTYAEHIAPILNRSCVQCHRPNEVAPFSLVGYENAKKWATMSATVADSRQMPPWKAVHGYGEFKSDSRLSEADIAMLKDWSAAGAPRGNPKLEPKTPVFSWRVAFG